MFVAAFVLLTVDDPAIRDGDEWRFPVTRDQAYHGYRTSQTHLHWIREHRSWDQGWVCEAAWRHRIWDLMDDLRRIHPNDKQQNRRKLAELKQLLGGEAYWRGIVPDYLPAWRFTER